MQDLKRQRARAQALLEKLKQERGAATLDGQSVPNAEIAEVENTLSALTEAEGEQARRQRREDQARAAALRKKLCTQLKRQETDRQKAASRAEGAARELVAALDQVLECAAKMRATVKQMNERAPNGLSRPAMVARLSQRLIAILATIPRHPGRFGGIQWNATWRAPGDNWAEKEAAEIAGDLERLYSKSIGETQ